jgi:hypothetical protein
MRSLERYLYYRGFPCRDFKKLIIYKKNMLGALGGLAMNALRTLAPMAINWGVKQLSNSRMGRNFIAPALQGTMPHVIAALQNIDNTPNVQE